MADNEVLTDAELAVEWKTNKQAIQKLLRARKIRAFKVGDQWRITRQAVIEYRGDAA